MIQSESLYIYVCVCACVCVCLCVFVYNFVLIVFKLINNVFTVTFDQLNVFFRPLDLIDQNRP